MTATVARRIGSVVGLFVGGPRTMASGPPGSGTADDSGGETGRWTSAIAKTRCDAPVFLGEINFVGDDQADRRVHGGPDKAVCCYAEAHYPSWWAEDGWPDHLGPDVFGPGAFGENLTLAAMTEATTCLGDVWRLGGATVQVSQPRTPCWKLGRRWAYPELVDRVRATDRTGWYVRVLATGVVAPDATVELLDRPHPEWTILQANRVHTHALDDLDAAARLAACPALATSWADRLRAWVERAG